nr:helix-turn-helix transcriptional regulator [Ruthenibacterium lactatiformans]
MDGNNLGNSIKTLRMAKGITQEELAYRINVSKATVFRLRERFKTSLL